MALKLLLWGRLWSWLSIGGKMGSRLPELRSWINPIWFAAQITLRKSEQRLFIAHTPTWINSKNGLSSSTRHTASSRSFKTLTLPPWSLYTLILLTSLVSSVSFSFFFPYGFTDRLVSTVIPRNLFIKKNFNLKINYLWYFNVIFSAKSTWPLMLKFPQGCPV